MAITKQIQYEYYSGKRSERALKEWGTDTLAYKQYEIHRTHTAIQRGRTTQTRRSEEAK